MITTEKYNEYQPTNNKCDKCTSSTTWTPYTRKELREGIIEYAIEYSNCKWYEFSRKKYYLNKMVFYANELKEL